MKNPIFDKRNFVWKENAPIKANFVIDTKICKTIFYEKFDYLQATIRNLKNLVK